MDQHKAESVAFKIAEHSIQELDELWIRWHLSILNHTFTFEMAEMRVAVFTIYLMSNKFDNRRILLQEIDKSTENIWFYLTYLAVFRMILLIKSNLLRHIAMLQSGRIKNSLRHITKDRKNYIK